MDFVDIKRNQLLLEVAQLAAGSGDDSPDDLQRIVRLHRLDEMSEKELVLVGLVMLIAPDSCLGS